MNKIVRFLTAGALILLGLIPLIVGFLTKNTKFFYDLGIEKANLIHNMLEND